MKTKIKYTSFIVVCLSIFVVTHYLAKGYTTMVSTTVISPTMTLKQPMQVYEVKSIVPSVVTTCGTGVCDQFGRNLGTTSGFIFTGDKAQNKIITYWASYKIYGAPGDTATVKLQSIGTEAIDGMIIMGAFEGAYDGTGGITITPSTTTYVGAEVIGEVGSACTNQINRTGATISFSLMSQDRPCSRSANVGVADITPTNTTVTKGNALVYVMFQMNVSNNDLVMPSGFYQGMRVEGNITLRKKVVISSI